MQRKVLLIFNHRSPTVNSGKPTGISNYMFALMRAIIDRGHFDVGLVTSWHFNDIPSDISSRLKSYTCRKLVRPRVFDIIWEALTMPALLQRLGADVVINIDPVGTPRGAPMIITVFHDVYYKMLPDSFKMRERWFSDWITRMMMAGSDKIVCASDRTKSDLDRFYPSGKKKSVRVYGDVGVGIKVEPANIERTDKILWIGKITGNKNVACLYKAIKILADRGEKVAANVVGHDLYGHAEAAEHEYGAGLHVTRMGSVSNDKLKELYNSSMCFVNTSTYEGFGMPVIEAQRSGLPVICSTGGAVAEVAGAGALTFDPDDSELLAAHISRVAGSPELRETMVADGYQNARRFSWDQTAAEYERLISENLSLPR